jgi:Di-haem cytochrome c peroxidase
MPAPVFTRPGLIGAAVLMPIDQFMERQASIKEYGSLFASALPEKGMNSTTPAEAIATYERTVVSGRSPFDVWIEGDEHAIPAAAKRRLRSPTPKVRVPSATKAGIPPMTAFKLTVKISDWFHLACSLEQDDVYAY